MASAKVSVSSVAGMNSSRRARRDTEPSWANSSIASCEPSRASANIRIAFEASDSNTNARPEKEWRIYYATNILINVCEKKTEQAILPLPMKNFELIVNMS